MLLYTVKGYKGEYNGGFLDIFLILRIFPVRFVLPDLKPSGPAEHHIDNPDVADGHDDPLPGAEGCWRSGRTISSALKSR